MYGTETPYAPTAEEDMLPGGFEEPICMWWARLSLKASPRRDI
jgi:hypothetical protein